MKRKMFHIFITKDELYDIIQALKARNHADDEDRNAGLISELESLQIEK